MIETCTWKEYPSRRETVKLVNRQLSCSASFLPKSSEKMNPHIHSVTHSFQMSGGYWFSFRPIETKKIWSLVVRYIVIKASDYDRQYRKEYPTSDGLPVLGKRLYHRFYPVGVSSYLSQCPFAFRTNLTHSRFNDRKGTLNSLHSN